MQINYRLNVDSVDYEETVGDLNNVVYKVFYTISVWEGNKTLQQVVEAYNKKYKDWEVPPMANNFQITTFFMNFEAPDSTSEDFVELEDINEAILADWLLKRYNTERLEDLYLIKNSINHVKGSLTTTKTKTGFASPLEGSVSF